MTNPSTKTWLDRALVRTHLTTAAAVAVVLTLTTAIGAVSASSPRFYDDDPIWVEPDTEDAATMKMVEVDLTVDLTYNLLARVNGTPGPAGNLNTIGEVPDSSWFTNRLGHRPMSVEEIHNGPDTSSGPAAGDWTVISSKSDGVTPGFTVKDTTGQVWFLKFDPPGHRGMATGTEVAVTKLMWALGYNVPENHVAYMRRSQLTIGPAAKFTPAGGTKRPMRMEDLDSLLQRADRERDGSFRVVASKALEGKPIGRIRFHGTRSDDPNDIVPHQDRRELRGYGVFAAWLNHVDAKAINSLDMLVERDGRAFVRHHLIDFGSALGSGGVGPADYWAGDQYLLQPGDIAKQIVGFGFRFQPWHTAKWYESPAIGRLRENHADFNPDLWRPRVPNRAFLHARADDKFWAAQKLAALTDAMIDAAVRAGEFDNPEAEGVLARALRERRDAIVRTYLNALNPIEAPALSTEGVLTFRNAAVEAGVAAPPQSYRATWSAFDNATGESQALFDSVGSGPRLEASRAMPGYEGTIIKVSISSVDAAHPAWAVPVDAYFRLQTGEWRLIGFARTPEA